MLYSELCRCYAKRIIISQGQTGHQLICHVKPLSKPQRYVFIMTLDIAPPLITEGKAKKLTPQADNTLWVSFKDSATAFNGAKKAEIPGKGKLNAQITAMLFNLLEDNGLPTCFVKHGPDEATLVYTPLRMIALEVVVRNDAWGSLCKRFGMPQGTPLNAPVVEFYLKDDALGDPQITEDVMHHLGSLPAGVTVAALRHCALAANEVLTAFFDAHGIRCADFKLEMGLNTQGQLVLGDELSPDNFRLRDKATGQVLDKDVFRQDLGDLVQTYTQLWQRLQTPVTLAQPLQAYQATVVVSSRKNILNPESKAIGEALQTNQQTDVLQVHASKQYALAVQAPSRIHAETRVHQLASTLLSNPVVEDVTVALEAATPEKGPHA
jgi:phosphoribosylaminoimidazole-succinocarboxamide synthase